VVAALVLLRWGGIRKGIWVDLDVYIRGAAAIMNHEQLYAVSVHGLPFTYSPFAALVFVPLQLLGNVDARWVLSAASLGCYVLVLVVCARRLLMTPASAALVGLAGLVFEPFLRNMLLGQINLILIALVVVDVFVVPARYRGMLIGIGVGIKLLPGVFILYLLLKREWWAALRCVATFAATVALGGVFAPRDSWRFWSGGFVNLSRFGAEAVIGGDNQSLNGAFMRLAHDTSPSPILLLLLSVAVLTLGLIAAKRQIDSGNDVAGLVCIAFASLLASPVSWTHHWVWAVVALLVLVQGRRRLAATTLGVIFVIGPMWFAPRGQLIELQHNWWQVAVCLSYVLVALTFLVFFGLHREGSHGGRDEAPVETPNAGTLSPPMPSGSLRTTSVPAYGSRKE
jgi:alpha-1,2-mannosyltransferase